MDKLTQRDSRLDLSPLHVLHTGNRKACLPS